MADGAGDELVLMCSCVDWLACAHPWPMLFRPLRLHAAALELAAANSGHGHVYPRADGVKVRCGGPALCVECARDQARKASTS